MLTPHLKAFDCLDHDSIESWIPQSAADVNYRLCLHIGLPDEEGADLFYVQVMTPEAMGLQNPGRSPGRHRVIVNPYTWENVIGAVRTTLEQCAGDDWDQQSGLLAKHFDWEFEGYRS